MAMTFKILLNAAALAGALLAASVAAHAGTLAIQYFSIPNTGSPDGDFGICCSSGPGGATLESIAVGSALGPDGMPVTAVSSNPIVDQNGSGEILWWTPGGSPLVTATGTGAFTLGALTNMYAPNNTGGDDTNFFETAILSGTLTGNGSDATVTVGSDDDTLVYLNGAYVGGNPGVHGTTFTTINLGDLTGKNSLEIFYADRAQVGANLSVSVAGAAVPEPATWALMLFGVAGLGAAMRQSRRVTASA
jgi:hypothetical protein